MNSARQVLETFDLNSLPNLDVVVLGALELLGEREPTFSPPGFKRPIVIGSAGALGAGRMMFAKTDAVFADESTFGQTLASASGIDGAILVSASGGKHAITTARTLKERNLPAILLTNNPNAPAKEFFDIDTVFTFPKNREPYTYNTSTYLGMVLASTSEEPTMIADFIEQKVTRSLTRNFASYSAFTFIVPAHLSLITTMIRIKFEEMFMPLVLGRAYSEEEIKHAKTVVTSGDECFISLGVTNEHYGLAKNRLAVPLPENANYGAIMAIAYYVIGKIQEAHPPYFKNSIVDYTKRMSEVFGTAINPIVE